MKIFRVFFIFIAGAALLLPAIAFLALSTLFGKTAGLFDTVAWRLEKTADALNKRWRENK
jgi:hypothetical protein